MARKNRKRNRKPNWNPNRKVNSSSSIISAEGGRESQRSVHVCSKCKWPFVNAYPSQKKRAAHKKQCGKIHGYSILSPATVESDVPSLTMKMEEETSLQNSDVIKQMKDAVRSLSLEENKNVANPDVSEVADTNLNGMNQEETPKPDEPMDPVTPNEEENQFVVPEVESTQIDKVSVKVEEGDSSIINSHLQVEEESSHVDEAGSPSGASHVVDSDYMPAAANVDFVPEESEDLKLGKVAATPDVVLNEALENHHKATSNDAVTSEINIQEDKEDVLEKGMYSPGITPTGKDTPLSEGGHGKNQNTNLGSAIGNESESETNTYNISAEEIATNKEYKSSKGKTEITEYDFGSDDSISETETETTENDCGSSIFDETSPPNNLQMNQSNGDNNDVQQSKSSTSKDSDIDPKGKKKKIEIKSRVVSWNNVEDEIVSESKKYHGRWKNLIGEASNRHGMLRRYNSLPHDKSYLERLYPSIEINGCSKQKTPTTSTKKPVHSPLSSSSEKKVQKEPNSSSSTNKKSAHKSSSNNVKRKRKLPWFPIMCCPTICQNIS